MPNETFRKHYLKLLACSIVCAALLAAIGYLPTMRLAGGAGGGGLTAMFCGIGVSLFASSLGSIPICLALGDERRNTANAILGATCIRFLAVLPPVAALTLTHVVDRVPFVFWVAISYLILLGADTVVSVQSLKGLRRANG